MWTAFDRNVKPRVGCRICDRCRRVIQWGVREPECPILLTPVQPIDFCGKTCEDEYKRSGGNRNKIDEIQKKSIES